MRQATAPTVTGTRFISASPVPSIAPVAGWALLQILPDTNQDRCCEYIARGPEFDLHLDVSRFRMAFEPTLARFAWLVRNGFPRKPGPDVPWDNYSIDAAIAGESRAVAA